MGVYRDKVTKKKKDSTKTAYWLKILLIPAMKAGDVDMIIIALVLVH